MRMAILTVHFNPCNYKQRDLNSRRFMAAMRPWSNDIFALQALMPGNDWVWNNYPCKVADPEKHSIWQKEALLNRLLRDVPAAYEAICWIDADVLFVNSDWFEQTVERLKHVDVVQPFSRALMTHKHGVVDLKGYRRGFARGSGEGHPGFAWACRREMLCNGFPDFLPCGGADHLMACAWWGRDSGIELYHERLQDEITLWRRGQPKKVKFGSIPGDIVHLYHGEISDRNYGERFQKLQELEFHPTDLTYDVQGLREWSQWTQQERPKLVDYVRGYFEGRREDQ